MKTRMLLLVLLCTMSFLFSETVVIHKTDGTTDEIAIALIDNIEITESAWNL